MCAVASAWRSARFWRMCEARRLLASSYFCVYALSARSMSAKRPLLSSKLCSTRERVLSIIFFANGSFASPWPSSITTRSPKRNVSCIVISERSESLSASKIRNLFSVCASASLSSAASSASRALHAAMAWSSSAILVLISSTCAVVVDTRCIFASTMRVFATCSCNFVCSDRSSAMRCSISSKLSFFAITSLETALYCVSCCFSMEWYSEYIFFSSRCML